MEMESSMDNKLVNNPSNNHHSNDNNLPPSGHASPSGSNVNPASTSDDNSLLPLPNWSTLNFSNLELEIKFRSYFFFRRLQLLRLTLPCLLVGFTALGVSYDVLFVGDSEILFYNRVLRYGCQIPLIVIFIALTFTSIYETYIQSINSFFGLILGLINIAVAVIGGEPDHGPQMLYYFVVYMFLQLRFLYAASICWILYVVFIIVVKATINPSTLGLSSGYMIVSNLALMAASYATEYWLRLEFTRHNQLLIEEQRSDDLLQTLLPERITQKLRNLSKGDNLHEQFDNISILFSDIVGFTSYSASISAREVVNFLNALFSTFDHITQLHSVLKVETIGDAYFCACGVIEPREDHAELISNMAFDMRYILQQFKCKNNFALKMRIGLHCGPVVAGVVGLKVPRYHLFGDSVTIASLMESTGEPNKIQISDSIAVQLEGKPDYIMTLRTDEDKEGKRKKIKTYWLESTAELINNDNINNNHNLQELDNGNHILISHEEAAIELENLTIPLTLDNDSTTISNNPHSEISNNLLVNDKMAPSKTLIEENVNQILTPNFIASLEITAVSE